MCRSAFRAEEDAADLHPLPDAGAGEGVPLQPLPDAAAADRDRAHAGADGATDQDLVPGGLSLYLPDTATVGENRPNKAEMRSEASNKRSLSRGVKLPFIPQVQKSFKQ